MKRHATDTVSLVFGLLFAAVVGWWGISEITDGSAELPAAWIGVATLLVIGIVGLISALRPRPAAAPRPDPVPAAASDSPASAQAPPPGVVASEPATVVAGTDGPTADQTPDAPTSGGSTSDSPTHDSPASEGPQPGTRGDA